MAQLAEMGIAIPTEYRGEMALAGDWEVVSQKPVESGQGTGNGLSSGVGIRKRKFEGQEEEEEEEEEVGETVRNRGWGSTTKRYPSHTRKDLESLFAGSICAKKEESPPNLKQEDHDLLEVNEHLSYNAQEDQDAKDVTNEFQVKQEDSTAPSATTSQVGKETRASSPGPLEVVFKKRKSKAMRPK